MKQAVILAAGEGQRLRPFTVTKPKVMLPIADKPILQYVVEALAKNGIRQIVIVVGYRREQIFDYMGSGEKFGVNIVYITQEKQLGTANALELVKNAVEDEFLVLHGDNLIEASTIASFTKARSSAVLVKKVVNPARYGVVTIENGLVKEVVESPEQTRGNIVNTGVYAFNGDVFDFIGTELHIPNVINKMVLEGKNVNSQETEGIWLDAVYPWDIISFNAAILRQIPAKLGGVIEAGASIKGQVSIGNGTTIKSNSYIVGPVIIGENCDIGPDVCILPATSIGDNVVISPFTEITNSVISDDVSIGTSSLIQDSVIDKGCFIKSHFVASSGQTEVKVDNEHHGIKTGAMLGVSCNVESCVTAQPGSIIGNYSQIQAMRLVAGRIPDRSLVI